MGLFTWELQALVEGALRYILLYCSKCSKKYQETWPIRSTNLMRHWEVHHPGELRKLYGKAKASGLPPDKTIQSFPVMKKFDFSTPLIDCFLSPEGSFGSTPTSMTQMGATHAIFDPEVYKALHLEYYLAHSLPFALTESPYLARIISYARICEDEPPSISRHSPRLALDHVYENLLKSWKL